jgi:hypothetical protein
VHQHFLDKVDMLAHMPQQHFDNLDFQQEALLDKF